ncbi:major capsid protein [Rathayibacter sp. VKM Ac-2630]|uniref:major capsid protein n=1 Tax=Rathayibacter sp. VKM Ac-2630 TaxID=1938617 RepID=UPI00191BFFEE|nr:major capsid protein [Rathayibacter sp. VKM Ac-2630]
MLITTDYITPTELTGYARAALADLEANQFTLSQFLPSENVDDLNYRFSRGGQGLAEAATFRAFDAESAIASRPGVTRVTGELPPISRKIKLSEYDRLRQRQLPDQIVNAVFNDTDRMVQSVAARIELARGAALATGKVSINEDGVIADVDFGRRAGHTNQAPGTLWTVSASATPIADLIAWSTPTARTTVVRTPARSSLRRRCCPRSSAPLRSGRSPPLLVSPRRSSRPSS